jgi:hypothetical protein
MCWCDVLFEANCGSRCLPVRRGASTPSSRRPDILGITVNGRKRREGGGTLLQNQRLRAQELVLLGASTFCTRISPALNSVEASITAVCHYGIVHGKQMKCFRSSQPSSQNLRSRPSAPSSSEYHHFVPLRPTEKIAAACPCLSWNVLITIHTTIHHLHTTSKLDDDEVCATTHPLAGIRRPAIMLQDIDTHITQPHIQVESKDAINA